MRIQRAVDQRLAAGWQTQGAVVELWDFDGRMVKVRTSGALKENEELRRAVLAELEQLIKAEIDPSIGVEA